MRKTKPPYDDCNYRLTLYTGAVNNVAVNKPERCVVGVPNRLSAAQRKRYIPYLNIHDECGLLGTLDIGKLRQLKRWLIRVGI